MIISNRTVGYSPVRGSPFSNRKGFSSRRPYRSRTIAHDYSDSVSTESLIDNTSIFRLKNTSTDFIFKYDYTTGVRLDKFKDLEATNYFINSSKVLWELCIRRKTLADTASSIYTDVYYIRPTRETFISPSVHPVVSPEGDRSFTFIWDNIKYDYANSDRTCKVTLVATLPVADSYIDLSLSVEANHSIGSDFNLCVSAVGMPSLSIRENTNSSVRDNDFLSVPILEGQTVLNPIERLQAPRFIEESIQYNEFGTKTYFGTNIAGYSPAVNLFRANYGNPGILSIPLLIFGNREEKEGFLYYAYDPDGLHAKNFQFYSNGAALNIKSYDLSDHEISPYGMGGKDVSAGLFSLDVQDLTADPPDTNEFYYGNRINNIGWSVRIRPYKSPTVWTDWYGAKLYKDEVVPDLEDLGVVPKSFYSRYLDNSIPSIKDTEIPICSVSYGHFSGSAEQLFSGNLSLQELYNDSTSGSNARAVNIYYPPTLAVGAIAGSTTGISAIYRGWEPWADGTQTGYSVFRSPDMTGINSVYSGAVVKSLQNDQYPYLYLLNSYTISTGSIWVQAYSGIDLTIKSLYHSNDTATSGDYDYYARNIDQGVGLTGFGFHICHASKEAYNKYLDIYSGTIRDGSFLYDDTVGAWGRGCYASEHRYYNPVESKMKRVMHPKGSFTHFYNSIQRDWLSGAKSREVYINTNWSGPTGDNFTLGHISEYPCDTNLNYVGGSLLYTPSSVVLQNYYSPLALTNPLYSGAPRSDALFGSLHDISWNGVSVEAKNWNQLNPIYSTVYGDRTVLIDWISPWISNTLDVSGLFGNVPGSITVYGYPESVRDTHEGRTVQIKNWIASHLNHYTRLTAGMASLQYSGYATGYTNHTYDTIANNLDASPWTGVRDYVKSIFRLLAYAPDYMYHGTIEHPLESWEASNSEAGYIARGIRASRIPNSSEWTNGDDTVIHGVRRHHDGDSILIWLSNWCSGSQGFTGVFDPEVYEFTKGYNVYSLGLSDNDYGVLTNLTLNQKNATYSIEEVLSENTFKAFLFEPITSVNTEQFLELTTDFTYVRYAYGQEELATSFCDVAYDYGCSITSEITRPIVGRNAPATQEIVNNLPPWMEGRQNTSSNIWKLVNSWGQNIEEIVEQTTEFISNKYIATADTSKKSILKYTDIEAPELLEDRNYNNLLYNSSFTIPGLARYNMPNGWTTFNKRSSSTYLTNNKAFVCPNSIVIETSGKFGQTTYLDNKNIKDLTASIYILADTTNVEVSLITIAETIDGRLISKQSYTTSRSSEWRRLNHTIEVNDKIYRIQFIVTATCDDLVYINAPMLSIGSKLEKWVRRENDNLPFIAGGNRFSQILAIGNSIESNRKINIFSIADEKEFKDIAIPTRIEPIINNSLKDLEPFTNNVYGRKVSFYKEVFDTQWAIVDNKIQLRSYSTTEYDVFREFSIRDLQFNSELTYGTITEDNLEYTPLLLTVRSGYLFVLGLETYFDTSAYVLKIIRAVDPYGDRGYLESIVDFRLDLPINIGQYFNEISESISTIAFSELDPNIMVISTNLARQFYYRLYFDYQYFSPANNRIYMIENYPDSKVSIT